MADTFEKRRKEQMRREKQARKAERRLQKKSEVPVSPYSSEAIQVLDESEQTGAPQPSPDSE